MQAAKRDGDMQAAKRDVMLHAISKYEFFALIDMY